MGAKEVDAMGQDDTLRLPGTAAGEKQNMGVPFRQPFGADRGGILATGQIRQ
jgi:hypothetical protein